MEIKTLSNDCRALTAPGTGWTLIWRETPDDGAVYRHETEKYILADAEARSFGIRNKLVANAKKLVEAERATPEELLLKAISTAMRNWETESRKSGRSISEHIAAYLTACGMRTPKGGNMDFLIFVFIRVWETLDYPQTSLEEHMVHCLRSIGCKVETSAPLDYSAGIVFDNE